MTAGTRTFRIDETLVEPKVLPPPPTRHALLTFLLALAAILHLGTAGWGDIQNGAEGFYASTPRAMLQAQTWTTPGPPLSHLLLIASYKFLGVTAMAARLPVAVATVAAVGFTFFIGEQLGGYWRGFVAGLIHLCGLGSFIWMRIVTPEPLFAACLAATIYCAICGYQRQRNRTGWFAGASVFAALACLTRGVEGLLYPALIFLFLALLFREARVRFRQLLRWPNVLIFLALVLSWLIWMQLHDQGFLAQLRSFEWMFPFSRAHSSSDGMGIGRFLVAHLIWWFPGILLVLPGVCLGWRKIFRPHEFEFADALPLCWMAAGFLPLVFLPMRRDFDSVSMWGAFALFAAVAWERMSPSLRLAGLGLTALTGAGVACAAALKAIPSFPTLPDAWLSARCVLILAGVSILLFSLAASHFSWRERPIMAIAVLMLGMVPTGMSIAEGVARYGPYLSLADAARFLQPKLANSDEVLFEGSGLSGSSLDFYLDRPPMRIEATPGSELILEKLNAAHPVYLVIAKERVPYWQEQLTTQFHIFHQETTCGSHAVLSNQP